MRLSFRHYPEGDTTLCASESEKEKESMIKITDYTISIE
jgi:hypothetical protein